MLAVGGDLDVDRDDRADRAALRRRAGRRRARRGPTSPSPRLTAERRGSRTTTRWRPLPAVAARLAGARPGRRLRRLPAVRACWPRCSPTATRPGWSSGWCSATASSPASAATSAFMGDPFDVRDPTALLLAGAPAARRRRSTRCCARVDEEMDRLATDGADRRRAGPHPGPDGDPPAARHRRGARPGAARWRCSSSSAATPSCSTSCPGWSARSPRSRSRAAAATLRPERRAVRRGHPAVPGGARSEPGEPRSRERRPGAGSAGLEPRSRVRLAAAEVAEREPCSQRADRDRRPPARGAAGRGCGCGCRSPRRTPTWPGRRCCSAQTLLSGTAERCPACRSPPSCRRSAAGSPPALDPDRLMLSGDGLVTGLDRMLEILADVLTGATLPGRRGGHRAGPAGRPDPGGAEPAGAPGPRRAAAADLRPHPYAVQTPEPGAGPRGPAGGAARAARRAGAPGRRGAGAGRRRAAGARRWTPPRRPWSAGPAPAGTVDAAARPAAGARPAAAGRPARRRCSPRCGSRCRRCPAPTPTTPRCSWPT